MRLSKYVKFREEKFGGVLFETRSEKVFTLNSVATAVVREINTGCDESEIVARLKERFEDSDGRDRARGARLHRRPAATRAWCRIDVVTEQSTRARLRTPPPAAGESAADRIERPRRAALRRLAGDQRVQSRLPALHRGKRPRQGVSRRARSRRRSSTCSTSSSSSEIPYLSFSGGEPMVHPLFFEMVEYVCARDGRAQDRDQRPLPHAGELRAPARRSASRRCR